MEFEKIRTTLASLGYYTSPKGTINLQVARRVSDEWPYIINGKDFFCRVSIHDGKFMVEEFTSQIPDEKFFESEAEVIAYIKEKFPL